MLEFTTRHLRNISRGLNSSLKLVIFIIIVKNIILLPKWLSSMTTTHSGLLYVVKIDKIQSTAFTAQSKKKLTSFATWHRQMIWLTPRQKPFDK